MKPWVHPLWILLGVLPGLLTGLLAPMPEPTIRSTPVKRVNKVEPNLPALPSLAHLARGLASAPVTQAATAPIALPAASEPKPPAVRFKLLGTLFDTAPQRSMLLVQAIGGPVQLLGVEASLAAPHGLWTVERIERGAATFRNGSQTLELRVLDEKEPGP